jgi:1-acyl-sn-glycerol-3-phosphate acyltransferase
VIRSLVVVVAIVVLTLWHTLRVLVASVFGVPDREGSVYRRAPVDWGRQLCRIAGVRVIAHGQEHLADGRSCVLVANHLSWFDIFALGAVLPRMNFVAKAELRRIPLFGRAAERSGQIFIERENRKAAFAAYQRAAERIKDGATVIVFPEGTRGSEYALRPFKKGPFVLAIAAAVPIIPVYIHGALEVQHKGSWRVTPGEIHLHFLAPIATTGLGYEQRDALARQAFAAMQAEQHTRYGVLTTSAAPSPPLIPTS